MITGRGAERLAGAVRATLQDLLRIDRAGVDDRAFLSALAEKVAHATQAGKVGVGLLEGGELRVRSSFGFPMGVAGDLSVAVSPDGDGLADRVTFKDVVYVSDLRSDPELGPYRDLIELLDVRGVAAIGWRAGSEVLGVLMAFDSQRPDGFDSDDVVVLQLVADFSAFVFRGRLSRKRNEILLRLSEQLGVLHDYQSMARAVGAAADQLLPGIACRVLEAPRKRPEMLRTVVALDVAKDVGPAEVHAAGTAAQQAMDRGEAIETGDIERDLVHGATVARAGFSRARIVPVTAAGPLADGRKALGTIGFLSRARAPFTHEERRLMDDLARLLGLMAQRAELLELEAESSAALRTALDAAIDISSSLEPNEVIDRLLQRAAGALEADRATLSVIEGDDLIIAGSYAADGTAFQTGRRFKYAHSPQFLEVMRTRRPLREVYRLEDVQAEAREAMKGFRHAVTVPIIESEAVVATVTVSRRRDHPFTEADGRLLAIVTSSAGVALQKARVYEDTKRLLNDAREVSRAKSDFLNLAGHELRTPLAVIRGYLSLVATGAYGEPPAEWTPVLSLLEQKSRELAVMVDSILVAARLESGRLLVGTEEVEVAEVAALAVERAGAAAALTGGAVVGRYPKQRLTIRGDPTQLAVVIDNLLSNAIKYSRPPAAVTVTVGAHQGFAEVRVADRGRGIAREHWDRIFEEFSRIETSGGDFPAGTGLGLFIARQIAERYGGTLVLEASELERGSTFLLRLPLASTD